MALSEKEISMTIEELEKDSEFQANVANAKDINEIIALFKEKGIDVTEEQLLKVADQVGEDELSESDMENVAGGLVVGAALAFGVGWAIGKAIRKAVKGY